MDIHQYEYLLAIAEYKNISKAARNLGISQPSLSNFLKKTEFIIGHTLFFRKGQTLTLSPAGELYLDTCQKIVTIRNQTYASIRQLTQEEDVPSFTIGVTPYMGARIFSQIFPVFRRRYPNVKIELSEGYSDSLKKGLLNGTIDIAFNRIIPDDLDRFNIISLTSEELLLCVPLYHPMAKYSSDHVETISSRKLSEFDDLPFVMWGNKTANRTNIEKYVKKHHISLTTVYESNNALTLDIMLQNDMGAGFLPTSMCLPDKNRVYFSIDPPLYTTAGILVNQERTLTKPERYLIYLTSMNPSVSGNGAHTIQHYNELAHSIIREFEAEPQTSFSAHL